MTNNLQKNIRVKAMCLIIHEGRILVADGDSMKSGVRPIVPSNFYRVLGGSLNFDESAEEGVRREIREELNSEIENLEKLDVIENHFTYAGERGHEIVFLFKGTLSRTELTKQDVIHIIEDTYEFDAVWVPIEKILNKEVTLYPEADYNKLLK